MPKTKPNPKPPPAKTGPFVNQIAAIADAAFHIFQWQEVNIFVDYDRHIYVTLSLCQSLADAIKYLRAVGIQEWTQSGTTETGWLEAKPTAQVTIAIYFQPSQWVPPGDPVPPGPLPPLP